MWHIVIVNIWYPLIGSAGPSVSVAVAGLFTMSEPSACSRFLIGPIGVKDHLMGILGSKVLTLY